MNAPSPRPTPGSDAIHHGTITPALLARQVEFALGDNCRATEWRNRQKTVSELLTAISTFQRGPKDGLAILQGGLLNDPAARTNANMKANDLLMVDHDTGVPITEIVETIKARGLFAVVYTTHSHLKTDSGISKRDLQLWMRRNDRASDQPSLEDMLDYLRDFKKIRPEVLEGTTLLPADETRHLVRHKPMPRARTVFLLDKPFVFAEHGENAKAAWVERYTSAMRWLGFSYDPACSDPCRLMYVPRVDSGADLSQHSIHVVPGGPLDLEALLSAAPPPPAKVAATIAAGDATPPAPGKYVTKNIARFMALGAESFRASAWLREKDPKGIRHIYKNEPRHDHECPREDAHSEPDVTDRAFMIRDAVPGGNGFGANCLHAGCTALASETTGKVDRAVWLDLLCDRHGVADAADLLQWCSEKARSEWDPISGHEPVSGVRPDSTQPVAPTPLRLIRVSSFAGKPVPLREMHVDPWIPARDITMIGGDGGTGKSLMAKQLAQATAAGTTWMGCQVKPGAVVYLAAEDEEDELHRRFVTMAAHQGVDLATLNNLHVLCLAEQDAVLASASRGDVLEPTKLWGQVHELVMDLKPALVVYDTLADLFAGNENSRGQAQQFVKMLRGLAIKSRSTGILLAHPSLAGMASGTGSSGSTAWNNSVRNRLYLSRVNDEWGNEVDPDARTLAKKKANYGRTGREMRVRWVDGVFVPDGGDVAAATLRATDAKARAVFMELLLEYGKQGRKVSATLARNYAPARFATHPKAKGLDKKALERAMESLLEDGRVKIAEEGPPSKRRAYLKADANAQSNA